MRRMHIEGEKIKSGKSFVFGLLGRFSLKAGSSSLPKIRKIIFIIIIFVVGVLTLNLIGRIFIGEVTQDVDIQDNRPMSTIEMNGVVPYFELPDVKGDTIKLSDFLEVPIVLTFWTTWNAAAADQIKIFDDYLRKDSRGLFKIIAVSSQEDKSVVNNFISRGGYEIEVLLDASGVVTDAYHARSLPTTYFIDTKGILRDVFVGVLSEAQLVEKAEILLR